MRKTKRLDSGSLDEIIDELMAEAGTAHAQLGNGIVFDPTQSAHAIQQDISKSIALTPSDLLQHAMVPDTGIAT